MPDLEQTIKLPESEEPKIPPHPIQSKVRWSSRIRNAAFGILLSLPGVHAIAPHASAHPIESSDGDNVMYQPGMDTSITPPGTLKADISLDSLDSNQPAISPVPKDDETAVSKPNVSPVSSSLSPEGSKPTTSEAHKFANGAEYVQHLFAISNSHSSSVIPGDTTDSYISRMDISGPGKSIGGGEKEFMLKEGNGSRIVTKDNIAIMQAFTPLKNQEPSLEVIKKDYGEPEYMKKGVSDPNMNLGPAGAFAFWKSPYGGGFAAMVDTSSNAVREIIVVNDSKNNTNYNYTQFLKEWGKLYLAPNGKRV